MWKRVSALLVTLTLPLQLVPMAQASAYDGHPKIVIILVIDQFRADFLERYRADFKGRGFKLFLDKGAYFPDCYYGYANTKTAPGHATIGTGAYTDGHGIGSNAWWDLGRNKTRPVSSVEDDRYSIIGMPAAQTPATPSPALSPPAMTAATQSDAPAAASPAATAQATVVTPGASPRNLLASTVGDELRLATEGRSKVYGISLKDRAAILPAGAAANGAFWVDITSGRFITSSYYMPQLPDWVVAFNSGTALSDLETAAGLTNLTSFGDQVEGNPAANDYELQFAEALIQAEGIGKRNTTDMLTISLSANDILGHHVGPDDPAERVMVDGLDTSLDTFFTWLDKNVDGGLGNVWIALTADHGVAPLPALSSTLGLKGAYIDTGKLIAKLNEAINQKFSPGEHNDYLLTTHQELPYLALNEPMFARAGINEQEAEEAVQNAVQGAAASLGNTPEAAAAPASAQPTPPAAPSPGTGPSPSGSSPTVPGPTVPSPAGSGAAANDAAMPTPVPGRVPQAPHIYRTYTREQLSAGQVPPTEFGSLLAHSYTPAGGWYVMVIPVAFQLESTANPPVGTNHYSPYSYDRHVPLGFYGAPFAPGTYHGRVQPVDLAATVASLLGVNQPSASIGTVLTEALKPAAAVLYPKELPLHPRPVHRRGRAAGANGAADAGDTGSPGDPAGATTPAKPATDNTSPATQPEPAPPAMKTPPPAKPAGPAPTPAPNPSGPASGTGAPQPQ